MGAKNLHVPSNRDMEAVQMTKAIETNKIVVVKVSEHGCTCAVNGTNKKDISWDALTDAARQQDTDLARIYSAVRAEARKMVAGNRALPIRCSVGQNETNVWWVASFARCGWRVVLDTARCGRRRDVGPPWMAQKKPRRALHACANSDIRYWGAR